MCERLDGQVVPYIQARCSIDPGLRLGCQHGLDIANIFHHDPVHIDFVDQTPGGLKKIMLQ